jgi:hypothetical protein
VQAGAGQDVLSADADDEAVEPPPAAVPPPPAPPPAPAEATARPLVRKESRATLVSARAATVARASEVVESSPVCNPRQQKAFAAERAPVSAADHQALLAACFGGAAATAPPDDGAAAARPGALTSEDDLDFLEEYRRAEFGD